MNLGVVAGGLKGEKPAAFSACASCHGEDGKGMNGMAPNLVKYNETLITHVLEHGKKGAIGTMPKMTVLNKKQQEAVAAYVQSISK